MPAYRKLPSGKHNYVVRRPDGSRKSFTDPLQRVAKQKALDYEAAIRRGEAVHLRDERITVAQWHAKWLRRRMVDASTARKDESRWRTRVEPQWGSWPLASIERGQVQEWVKELSDAGAGAHAIAGAYELLGTLLSAAVDDKVIGASPCYKITLPRRDKPEPRWLTRPEYDRLQMALGAAQTTRGRAMKIPDPQAPTWQALVGLACFTGLRPGELAGLDISSVDFDRGMVRVTQVLTRVPDGVKPNGKPRYRMALRRYPKSDRSIRSVPFPPEVGELLWRIVADRGSGPVFVGAKGARVHYEGNFRKRVWLPALELAGIEAVRPYVTRHTFASWCVQSGMPDRKIMQYLGHADDHLIEVYAHLNPDEHDEIRAMWGEGSRRTDATRPPTAGATDMDNRRSAANESP